MQNLSDAIYVLAVLLLAALFAPLTIAAMVLRLPHQTLGWLFLDDLQEISDRLGRR